jgi:hypothetical protein
MNDLELVSEGREMTVQDVQTQVAKIQELMAGVLKDGQHYGVIPGTKKPSLLKPGAEKINLLFQIGTGDLEVVKTDMPGGHREITIKTPMILIRTGKPIAYGVGSCSTMESKYRYREQKRLCPSCGAEAIIKGKEDFGGGWLCWKKKGGCGAKFADGDEKIEGQKIGRIENEDIADVYNTVLKMAAKRSYVDGTIKASAASDFFTQDVEDFTEAEFTEGGDSRHDDSTPTGKPAGTLGNRLTTLIMNPKLSEEERAEIRNDYRGKCKTDKQRDEFLAGWEKDVAERGAPIPAADPTKAQGTSGEQETIPF